MYKSTIGLEIHIELDTETKMFCGCPNDPDERDPNVNVCPVCLGHPGTLPMINKEAVESVIKLGLALGGKIADQAHFDRKSYFYPDLPKGYQISQYDEPFVTGGELITVQIERIHLEEDTGRLVHMPDRKASLVDFNRAGVPLLELVTKPDITSADQAVTFARELQLILRYLEISRADMEKGQMRIEANVSLDMGTKVEVKNINSFRAVHGAILYELERQKKALKQDKEIKQETRGWVEDKQITKSQRTKESAHDYRYFPEPDLPPLDMTKFDTAELKTGFPELPEAKRERLKKEYRLDADAVKLLVNDRLASDFFEKAASEFALQMGDRDPDFTKLYTEFVGNLRGIMRERSLTFLDKPEPVRPEYFSRFVVHTVSDSISSTKAKSLLAKMLENGESPEAIMRKGMFSVIDDESKLRKIAEVVINEHIRAVEDYKKGKQEALNFLIGQVMMKTEMRANTEKVAGILIKLLRK